jgi:hypothetical protein
MNGLSASTVFLVPAIYSVLPLTIVWGWVRWRNSPRPGSWLASVSFAGFALASASAALAVLAVIFGIFIGGFHHYDGRLLAIYGLGALLSVIASFFAFPGIWRSGPLRWHAPVCSIGTLVFWIIAASFA